MEKPMKGQVVVVPFPFSDLSGAKRRPALVIADWGGEDIVLCQITSKTKQDGIAIVLDEIDFETGRLPVASNIRPNKIFTAERTTIVDIAGKITDAKYDTVVDAVLKLVNH